MCNLLRQQRVEAHAASQADETFYNHKLRILDKSPAASSKEGSELSRIPQFNLRVNVDKVGSQGSPNLKILKMERLPYNSRRQNHNHGNRSSSLRDDIRSSIGSDRSLVQTGIQVVKSVDGSPLRLKQQTFGKSEKSDVKL